MKLVVAPTAYKGFLSAPAAAEAIAAGIRQVLADAELDLCPISDGGDGFLDTLERALGLRRHRVVVRGPSHSPVAAAFGLRSEDGLAVVELAQSSGIALQSRRERDPLGASTGGLGEVLAEARQAGAASFLVGLGGSASTDGGTGMARALGYRFLDARGQELPEGGGALARLDRIDPSGFDPSWLLIPVTVACDVDNPLLGAAGAAATYGPQKGASPAQVERLEAGLRRLAEVLRRDLGADVADIPGAGAAGGTAAGMMAFLGAGLEPGARAVLGRAGLAGRLRGASALLTGEGRLDRQSLRGKAPVVAGRLARGGGVRSVALVGSTGDGWEATLGDAFDEVRVVTPPGTQPEVARREAAELLTAAAREVALSLA